MGPPTCVSREGGRGGGVRPFLFSTENSQIVAYSCSDRGGPQVLSGETRFLRIRAYPEKIGGAARFWSISAHCRTVQYILYFSTFVLLLLLLFYGTSVKFQMLNLSKFVSLALKFQIFDLSKFVSLAVKFQIFDLSKFVSLAYCGKMQAHSTMRGKRPKIIDVDLLSDVSSPKCH